MYQKLHVVVIPVVVAIIYLKGYYDMFSGKSTAVFVSWMCFAVLLLFVIFGSCRPFAMDTENASIASPTPSKTLLKKNTKLHSILSASCLLTVIQTKTKPGPGRVVRPGPGDFLSSTPCARVQQTRTKTHESRK